MRHVRPILFLTVLAAIAASAQAATPEEEIVRLRKLGPVSLSVKNASGAEVIAQLNDALNTPARMLAPKKDTGPYTLDVKNKPLWEVVAELSQQHAFSVDTCLVNVSNTQTNTFPTLRRYAVDGPAMGYISAINFTREFTLQTRTTTMPTRSELKVSLCVALDPRILSTSCEPIAIKAQDDLGHVFDGYSYSNNHGLSNLVEITFLPQFVPGKTMALTYEANFKVQTYRVTTMDDVQKNPDKSATVGERTFQVPQFEEQPDGRIKVRVVYAVPPAATNPNPGRMMMREGGGEGGGGTRTSPLLVYTVLDSQGKRVWSSINTLEPVVSPDQATREKQKAVEGMQPAPIPYDYRYGSMGADGSFIRGQSTGPYRLEIQIPDQVVNFPVKLVFTDIPLR